MTGRVLDGHTVLVVEDEFLVAALLADVLEDAGARVLGPASGLPAALSLVDAGGFDCAVLDWNLDGTCSDPIARALEPDTIRCRRNLPPIRLSASHSILRGLSRLLRNSSPRPPERHGSPNFCCRFATPPIVV
jgi:CheY-like chemotaxis protein